MRKLAIEVKENMINSIYSNNKITDYDLYVIDKKKIQIIWREEDCDIVGDVIDYNSGELIGIIRIYRLKIWLEVGTEIEEFNMNDSTITIG